MIKDYLDEILDGKKTFDARSYDTSKRGVIALVDSSTSTIRGVVNLVGVRKITKEEYVKWHQSGRFEKYEFEAPDDKEYYAYDFTCPRRLAKPIKVNKDGKTWCHIDDKVKEEFYFQNSLF